MVLEALLNPFKAEKRPWEMFFIGFVYSSIGIMLSLWIFKDQTSLIMVFLTVMASIPIVYATMRVEEKKDLLIKSERELLHHHNRAILFFMFLFIGMTASFVVWYVTLPLDMLNIVFEKQTATIQAINNHVSGNFFSQLPLLSKILLNNLKVLAFSVFFALLYGAGAIFILTWNASVIGAAMGNFIRSNLGEIVGSVGMAKLSGYFGAISLGLLRYSIHGVPEIVAYFYGGLAGGILSVAIMRKHYKDPRFSRILIDVCELLIISVSFLVIAGLLEVYVTPLMF